MHLFLVEPKGKIARKVVEKYEPEIYKEVSYFPNIPYFLYRVKEGDELEYVERIKVSNRKPHLLNYSNGEESYFEETTYEGMIIYRKHPYSLVLKIPGTRFSLGDVVAYVIFLGLRDEKTGLVRSSLWMPNEVDEMNFNIIDMLLDEADQREGLYERN